MTNPEGLEYLTICWIGLTAAMTAEPGAWHRRATLRAPGAHELGRRVTVRQPWWLARIWRCAIAPALLSRVCIGPLNRKSAQSLTWETSVHAIEIWQNAATHKHAPHIGECSTRRSGRCRRHTGMRSSRIISKMYRSGEAASASANSIPLTIVLYPTADTNTTNMSPGPLAPCAPPTCSSRKGWEWGGRPKASNAPKHGPGSQVGMPCAEKQQGATRI